MFFSSDYDDYEFDLGNLEANLTSTCNMNCDCSTRELQPICGICNVDFDYIRVKTKTKTLSIGS
jgi:hypothetical protein